MPITSPRPFTIPFGHATGRVLKARPLPSKRSYSNKAVNPTAQFYKTFTRPVAKVLLVAVLTYQFLYWSWVKLEQDEYRTQTDTTINELEAKVEAFQALKGAEKQNTPKKGWSYWPWSN